MFDITLGARMSTTVKFNAVSGTLVKSCPESKIARFHMNSTMADYFFDKETPHRDTYPMKKITVLQVMLCADSYFLVEYLDIEEKE